MKFTSKAKETQSLRDRINAVITECQQFVDDKAAELKLEAEGVPTEVIKGLLMARSGGSVVQAALNIMDNDR